MRLRHVKSAILELDNGENIHVQLIGKGRFSEAWKNSHFVYVITREREWGTDYSKEMLSHLDDDERGKHIPLVNKIGELGACRSDVYRMPLYKALESRDKEAWKQFKELSRIRDIAWQETFIEGKKWNEEFNNHLGLAFCGKVIDLARESSLIPESLVDCLEKLYKEISNYGDSWVFEFAKRNLCVDREGNLILIDCLFDLEVLERERVARQKRNGRRY